MEPARPSRAQTLLASSVFDAEYYAATVGISFPDEPAAARHCVREGMPQSLSPSPLLEIGDLPRAVQDAWRAGRVGAVLGFLRRTENRPVGPLFDGGRAPGTDAEKAAHPGGALGLFLDRADEDTVLPVPDAYGSPAPTWGAARRSMLEHVRAARTQAVSALLPLTEWDEVTVLVSSVLVSSGRARRATVERLPFVAHGESPASDPDDPRWLVVLGDLLVDWVSQDAQAPARDQGVVSVVIPTYGDWRMTTDAVRAVLQDDRDAAATESVEVVVVDNGSPGEVGRRLMAGFLTEPRVRYLRLPRNLSFAVGCNAGFAAATGATVVFLNNDTVVRRGWLDAMLPHLAESEVRGVQPLLLYPDDTVQSAGTVFCDSGFLPVHLLAGHPVEDAERLSQRPFSAVTAAALAVRATEFAALHGFDPVFVNGMEDIDYCLRATRAYGGGFLVEPAARVTHLESRTPGRNANVPANRRILMDRWRGQLPGPELDRYAELGLTVAHLASDGQSVSAARPVVVRPPGGPEAGDPGGPPRPLRWGIKTAAVPGPAGDTSDAWRLAGALSAALGRLGQEVVSYRRGAHAGQASYLDDVVLGIRGDDPVVAHPGKVNVLWLPDPGQLLGPAELAGFDLVYASSAEVAHALSIESGRLVEALPEPAGADLDPQAHALVAAVTACRQRRAGAGV